MNHTIATIRKFTTSNFTVLVTAEEDHDLDLSFDEDGSVARDLESGKLMAFCVKAAVLFRGAEIAAGYLGGCIYGSPAEFEDHRECGRQNKEWAARGDKGRCGSYFKDMISLAIAEARKEVAAMKSISLRA